MTWWSLDRPGCQVIGEVGLAHEGSLGMAFAYIDAIAAAGCHAVKFQTHLADAESTPREQFRVPLSGQDATRYDYWQRTGFDEASWRRLVERAHERGLGFISSPFSTEALDLLVRVGADAIKIASGEVSNLPLLKATATCGLPILISSGLSPLDEIDEAVTLAKTGNAPVAVFQCTSNYPCPPERVGLNLIAEMRQRYGVKVGLSDHSGTIYAGLAAAALGCDLVEVHVCFSRAMYGPDVPASLTLEDLARLSDGLRFVGRALAAPVDKDAIAADFGDMRRLFTRSVVAATALPESTVLTADMLAYKKPGIGLPPRDVDRIIGRRLRHAIAKDQCITEDDVGS